MTTALDIPTERLVPRVQERNRQIIDAVLSGDRAVDVARKFGVGRSAVSVVCKKAGLAYRKTRAARPFEGPQAGNDGTTAIPLTQGKVATVDSADLPIVRNYIWFAVKSRRASGRLVWYAHGYPAGQASGPKCFMHRLIIGCAAGELVDHWDGDGLNNRRSNIRPATEVTNGGNRVAQRRGQFKGVVKIAHESKYRAVIGDGNGGGTMAIGMYETEGQAALAYDAAARLRWGEYACVNFPEPGERSAITGDLV